MDIREEIVLIKKCLESGDKLSEEQMIILFFFSFLQEEGKIGFEEKRRTAK